MTNQLKKQVKLWATRHIPRGDSNVFLHSLPRSGSTWLMELVLTQPGFTICNEPLNIEKPAVKDNLGISDWSQLHDSSAVDKLYSYFQGISSGTLRDYRFNRPGPFSGFYRPITRRVVFKIIHAAQQHINWLADCFNGRVLFLLRHPIPVTLSRQRHPALDSILNTDFATHFTETQLSIARDVIRKDDHFARGILDWCLKTSVALRSRREDWTVLTYEQLVLDPMPAINRMVVNLDLPKPQRITRRLATASRSTNLSDPGTRKVLQESRDKQNRLWLVEKWRQNVSKESLSVAADLLNTFELSGIYDVADSLPTERYWISEDAPPATSARASDFKALGARR